MKESWRKALDTGDYNEYPKVSVIVPIFNEQAYILNCIKSVEGQTYPAKNIELLLVDGKSTDNTINIITKYLNAYKGEMNIILASNPRRIAPAAMNIGIHMSTGKFIIRLDAHSEYPSDYIEKLLIWKKKLSADNVGAVCKTEACHHTKKSKAIVKVLSNQYGVGNSIFRIGSLNPVEVDTVPFGCYEKKLLIETGLYDERLIRNQDIELNQRIRKRGGKIFLIPEVVVTYFARETYSAIAKNNYGNGIWNLLTIYYTKDFHSLSMRHFIPLIFLLSLIVPTGLVLVHPFFFIIAGLSFTLYNLLVISQSIKMNDSETTAWSLMKAFYTLHFSYGWGSFMGLFKILKLKIFGEG